MIRDIVTIDEDHCTGCGECVPACAEGAIRIVDGKARLVSDRLCDGLGACLGHCPQGAIQIERREATTFDEEAVRHHAAAPATDVGEASVTRPHMGCPSAQFVRLDGRVTTHVSDKGYSEPRASASGPRATEGPLPYGRGSDRDRPSYARSEPDSKQAGAADSSEMAAASELTQWPVQLRLLPAQASMLHGARLLVAADCVPVALADFHSRLLRDHAVVIACPKLDDPSGYIEKLADMIRQNDLAEITVARMEVPCCAGILRMVLEARHLAGRDVPMDEVVIGIRGEILARRRIPAESNVSGNGESARCPITGVH